MLYEEYEAFLAAKRAVLILILMEYALRGFENRVLKAVWGES